ncbi:MAG: AtpZ/AtpI family protein [Actinobacteria bacterium]|nr:AtpZ/AtpI family protein [Actinomycetota bacterium]
MQAGVGQLSPERIPTTFPGDDRSRVERQYLRFAGVGIQYAATILVMTLLGIWLDNRADSAPIFLLIFLLLGFVGATWSLIQQVLGPGKKKGGNK